MGKQKKFTDKDVAYRIAQILVREITQFQPPQYMTLPAALEALLDSGAPPLMTYASLAAELNRTFGLTPSPGSFSAINIEPFLSMLLKESIGFTYKVAGIQHVGRIRKKLGRDIPITAIVVNAKTHLPGKQFFTYFPAQADQRQTALAILETLFSYRDWDEYLKRIEKVFGKK